jgi:hypothetical protein
MENTSSGPRSKPSNVWYYVLAVVFAGIGVAGFGLILWNGLSHLTGALTQVVVPGHIDLALRAPGTYTVFYESESVLNGHSYSTPESVSMSDLTCSVTSRESDEYILLQKPSASVTYTLGGRSGKSVLQFHTSKAGHFRLSCRYPEEKRGPDVVIAVGRGVGTRILITVLGGLASFFGGLGIAGGIVFWAVSRRRESAEVEPSNTVLPI